MQADIMNINELGWPTRVKYEKPA